MRPLRVALLTNILSPYRAPVYRALGDEPDVTLRVFLCAESEFDRSWRVDPADIDTRVVASWSLRRRIRTTGPASAEQIVTLHVPWGIVPGLQRFGPDVVVSAELGPRTLLALAWCTVRRVPLVIWSYHSRVSATSASPGRRALRRLLLALSYSVIGMVTKSR